jgi:hypothetical protein
MGRRSRPKPGRVLGRALSPDKAAHAYSAALAVPFPVEVEPMIDDIVKKATDLLTN